MKNINNEKNKYYRILNDYINKNLIIHQYFLVEAYIIYENHKKKI